MKNRTTKIIAVMLLIALVSAFPQIASANSTTDFVNSETYLRTSYNQDEYLEFSISGNTLTVSGKLLIDGLDAINVRCGNDIEHAVSVNTASGEYFSARLTLVHNGTEVLKIRYARTEDHVYDSNGRLTSETYHGIGSDRFYIERTGAGYRIVPSLVLEQNLAIEQAYVNPDDYRDASNIPESVKKMSNEIVAGATNDYDKIFLLHKWVAGNIYYDFDYFFGRSDSVYVDSAGVLNAKRSVCEGYATLLKDLIIAQGIPCMEIGAYALGLGAAESSFAVYQNMVDTTEINHACVEAWVNDRWVIMDPTWDSNNRYEIGRYVAEAPIGFFYFDITPEAIAYDHKYITRADGKINDDASTGADTLPTFTATPTSSTVLVNGENVSFDAYTINDNNYFKLRDLAQILSGTEKQFDVKWDATRNTINLISNRAYTTVGGEMTAGDGTAKSATPTSSVIYKDGKQVTLTAYNIGGNNYFKLRDIGKIFNFGVTWDGANNAIVVDTSRSYTDE